MRGTGNIYSFFFLLARQHGSRRLNSSEHLIVKEGMGAITYLPHNYHTELLSVVYYRSELELRQGFKKIF